MSAFSQGEQGLNGPPGQAGPPGPMVGFISISVFSCGKFRELNMIAQFLKKKIHVDASLSSVNTLKLTCELLSQGPPGILGLKGDHGRKGDKVPPNAPIPMIGFTVQAQLGF